MQARKDILQFHINKFDQKSQLTSDCIDEFASELCGYSGADIKALCYEAVMCAFRRKYPQIYEADCKMKPNLKAFTVTVISIM
jgi:ATP-dependent 26S proteasome regulatory subunit